MTITYYGHSCFLVEMAGQKIVIDPFIRPNAKAAAIDFNAVEADYILVTHGHSDHTADLVALAKQTGAKVVSTYELVQWVSRQGIENIHPMNIGGKWRFDFGTLLCTYASHSSSLEDGTYMGNPLGFVLWNEQSCIYIAGDTALTMEMKLLPQLCPKLDVAILPIGDNFTMDVKQAAIASDFIECNTIIGCHYDTFGFIEIDHDEARKVFSAEGKELILLPIGNSQTFE